MFYVIFQVKPSESGYQEYLQTAAALRPQLDHIEGFLSIERFRSIARKGWILSLSKWADEASLVKWRTTPEHHEAQKAGRDRVFEDYRLRVAQMTVRVQSGADEQKQVHRTSYRSAQGAARFVSVLEIAGLEPVTIDPVSNVCEIEWYESLADPGKRALVIGWNSEEAACQWHYHTHTVLNAMEDVTHELSLAELERDYGLFQRTEAPQYYPPVVRPT
jgi:heme-degrading monooxygenase HmoA